MSAPSTSMQIEPSPDARWVGRRLGALLAPGVESVAQAIAWCDEQVRHCHMCLDFTLSVVGRASGEDADATEGQARLPMEWLADVRGLASAATRDRGSLALNDQWSVARLKRSPISRPPPRVIGDRLRRATDHWSLRASVCSSRRSTRTRSPSRARLSHWRGDPHGGRRARSMLEVQLTRRRRRRHSSTNTVSRSS